MSPEPVVRPFLMRKAHILISFEQIGGKAGVHLLAGYVDSPDRSPGRFGVGRLIFQGQGFAGLVGLARQGGRFMDDGADDLQDGQLFSQDKDRVRPAAGSRHVEREDAHRIFLFKGPDRGDRCRRRLRQERVPRPGGEGDMVLSPQPLRGLTAVFFIPGILDRRNGPGEIRGDSSQLPGHCIRQDHGLPVRPHEARRVLPQALAFSWSQFSNPQQLPHENAYSTAPLGEHPGPELVIRQIYAPALITAQLPHEAVGYAPSAQRFPAERFPVVFIVVIAAYHDTIVVQAIGNGLKETESDPVLAVVEMEGLEQRITERSVLSEVSFQPGQALLVLRADALAFIRQCYLVVDDGPGPAVKREPHHKTVAAGGRGCLHDSLPVFGAPFLLCCGLA